MSSYYEKVLATGEVKCIDEEIPFDVPNGWEWERWGNISQSIQYGYNAPALEHGAIKMVRISDIQENCVLWDNVPYCQIEENDIDTYLLKVNDILFARTGGTVGKSFLVEEVPERAIYAGYLIRTRYSSLLNPRYMKSFMESQLYWEQLKNGTIATAQPNCNGKTLAKMLLPIPPSKEQERIVEKLTQLSSFLDNYGLCQDRLNLLNKEIKEQFKKSILQEAIQGKLVPQLTEEGTAQDLLEQIKIEKLNLVKGGKLKKSALATSVIFRGDDNKYWEKNGKNVVCIDKEIPFEIPNNWNWCRLKDIGKTETGTTPSKLHPEYFGNYIPFLSPANIFGSKIISETQGLSNIGVQFGRVVPKNSILQVCIGGSIGKCAIVNKPTTFNQQINSITPYFCNVEFVHIVLQSEYFRLAIIDKATGTATPIINRGNWETLLFPLPPLKEQQRIIEKYKSVTSIMSR